MVEISLAEIDMHGFFVSREHRSSFHNESGSCSSESSHPWPLDFLLLLYLGVTSAAEDQV